MESLGSDQPALPCSLVYAFVFPLTAFVISCSARLSAIEGLHDEIFLLFMMVDFLLGTSNLHLIGFLTITFLTLILLKFVYTFGHLLNSPVDYYHGSKHL